MKHSHRITSVELPSRCLLSLGILRFAAAEDNLNLGWDDSFTKLRYGSELQNFECCVGMYDVHPQPNANYSQPSIQTSKMEMIHLKIHSYSYGNRVGNSIIS